jgi:hypothetical protein
VSEQERELPPDPAGTQPKVPRDSVIPADPDPLVPPREPFAETPEPEDDGPPPLSPPGLREPPHFARFQFLLGALLAIGLTAVVALGVIWATDVGDGDDGFEWSAWAPSEDGVKGAQQIAEHVAPQYRLPNGEQMVHVTASGLEAFGVDLSLVMRERPEEGGEIREIGGDTVVYRMCGLAARCTLKGKPSFERAALLRREALELALYSLRYLRGADQVFVFLPTSFQKVGTGKRKRDLPIENQGLLLRREDMEPSLAAPLRATLDARPPALDAIEKARERPLLETVAARSFAISIVPANNDDAGYLVLEKLTTEELIERQLQAERERQAAGVGGALGVGG